MNIKSYRDLKVWQAAMDLVSLVYQITAEFPKAERFGLAAQMRRAVISIPSNIAEGHARRSSAEYLRFLSIALASLAEVEAQLLIAMRLGYSAQEQYAMSLADQVGKMLRGLEHALKRKRPTGAT